MPRPVTSSGMTLLDFAWARPQVDIFRQLFGKIFRTPYQIPHLLVAILWARQDGKKLLPKKSPKMNFTGVKIAWVKAKSNKHKKIYTFVDLQRKTPTHTGAAHEISKIKPNFENRIFMELVENFYIPRVSVIHRIISNNRI